MPDAMNTVDRLFGLYNDLSEKHRKWQVLRAQQDITTMNDDFLSRVYDSQDPNAITPENYEDALTQHKQKIDDYIQGIGDGWARQEVATAAADTVNSESSVIRPVLTACRIT